MSRIVLIPSVVDETFCRVGYEAMMNGIPTLATNSGNLRYLLKDYADYVDKYDSDAWLNKIESIYFNKKSYYVDLDFECEDTDTDGVFYDIYGTSTEPEICQD